MGVGLGGHSGREVCWGRRSRGGGELNSPFIMLQFDLERQFTRTEDSGGRSRRRKSMRRPRGGKEQDTRLTAKFQPQCRAGEQVAGGGHRGWEGF